METLFTVGLLLIAFLIVFVLIEAVFGEGSMYGFSGMGSMIYGASLYDQKPGISICLMLIGVMLMYLLNKEHEKRRSTK